MLHTPRSSPIIQSSLVLHQNCGLRLSAWKWRKKKKTLLEGHKILWMYSFAGSKSEWAPFLRAAQVSWSRRAKSSSPVGSIQMPSKGHLLSPCSHQKCCIGKNLPQSLWEIWMLPLEGSLTHGPRNLLKEWVSGKTPPRKPRTGD